MAKRERKRWRAMPDDRIFLRSWHQSCMFPIESASVPRPARPRSANCCGHTRGASRRHREIRTMAAFELRYYFRGAW